ncbi:MAG: hypothetical protein IJS84_05605 [Spirochaetales bacterium]|nr:hypothetical protein [Spirochaetales bacterium]
MTRYEKLRMIGIDNTLQLSEPSGVSVLLKGGMFQWMVASWVDLSISDQTMLGKLKSRTQAGNCSELVALQASLIYV